MTIDTQEEPGCKRQRCLEHADLEEAEPAQLQAPGTQAAAPLHPFLQDEPRERDAGYGGLERLCTPAELGGAGLLRADLDSLVAFGIQSLEVINFLPLRRLQDVRGFDLKKASRAAAAAKRLAPLRIASCADLLRLRAGEGQLTTGAAQLDRLLGGGVETGQITEVFGEFRSGKTQLCHTLCVSCQLPREWGGAESKALYVDTEGTFRPERLVSIAQRYGIHEEDVLENVTCCRAYNAEHQERLLAEVDAVFAASRYALLIIDSATSLFRTDYAGQELPERQLALNRFLRKLQCIADEHSVAVVMTNQVRATAGGNQQGDLGQHEVAAVGGNIMAHASQTRLFFRKGNGNTRICRLYDSSSLPEGEAMFAISGGGVVDTFAPV